MGAKIAVTGVTGSVGRGLMPVLETDGRVERVVGLARRPLDADSPKLIYHRADMRDRRALAEAFEGADAVVHLAFSFYGLGAPEEQLHDGNVGGTMNALEAAAAAGVKRFVYASSAVVYGFWPESGIRPITEDEPMRPSPRHFYSRQKVEVERRMAAARDRVNGMQTTILRPVGVVGPNFAQGLRRALPGPLRRLFPPLLRMAGASGVRPPVVSPTVPFQFVHQEDVGRAAAAAALGDGEPGIYNLAGAGTLDPDEAMRHLGLRPLPVPGAVKQAGAGVLRAAATLPLTPPGLQWSEALRGPVIVDTTRAREQLGWRPRFTSAQALEDTRRSLGL